ncbi:hypothetical protein IP85_19815 [Rhizobium sp. AAP116]|nr:hypothetical protein IP85_19815 [Rhizobium sp. AAP116]
MGVAHAARSRFSPLGRRWSAGPDEGGAKRKAMLQSIGGFMVILCAAKSGSAAPSSGATRHLLPAGEKKEAAAPPSIPLVGGG